MKKLEAIIDQSQFQALRSGISSWVTALTVSEVRCYGLSSRTETYRGSRYVHDFVTKLRVEVLVSEEVAPSVAEAIAQVIGTNPGSTAVVALVDEVGPRSPSPRALPADLPWRRATHAS